MGTQTIAANVLSLTLPLMRVCLLLSATGALRTASPHQRSGKMRFPGVGLAGWRKQAALLALVLCPGRFPPC